MTDEEELVLEEDEEDSDIINELIREGDIEVE